MSNFDREQAQRLVDRWNYDDGLQPEWLAKVMVLLESALVLHDEHKKVLRELAELRAHPKVAFRLQQAAEHRKLKDEHERLTAAHATLLSREAKEQALRLAFIAGLVEAPKGGDMAQARRLLDLDPEDA
jgi:hypothetical protein